VPLAANALCFFVLYGTQFFIAQYLQLVLGLSALQAGLWTIPSALGYLAGSALAPVAANRLRPAWTMSASLAVTAVGFGLLTQVGPQSGLPVVVAGSVIGAIGLAPVYVLTTDLTVAAVPPARSGTASGLLTTTANLGGALGIAFLGSLGGAIYRSAMTGPDARLTLGGALTTDSARDAFTLAFRIVEAGGASMIAAVAVVSAVLLRRPAPAYQR
jgi:MFS transporter, DHA2 family, multidrug resistance protein